MANEGVERVHVGDVGTRFIVTINIPIDSATTKEFIFKPPLAAAFTRPGSLLGDGTDGVMYYDTTSADLLEPGPWRLQAHIVTPSGEWHTEVGLFTVLRNL